MNRAQLEALRAAMLTAYQAQLEREQPHLTVTERATLCLGFTHGVGWFARVLETQGALRLDVEAVPPAPVVEAERVCIACRGTYPLSRWARGFSRRDVPTLTCPRCATAEPVTL